MGRRLNRKGVNGMGVNGMGAVASDTGKESLSEDTWRAHVRRVTLHLSLHTEPLHVCGVGARLLMNRLPINTKIEDASIAPTISKSTIVRQSIWPWKDLIEAKSVRGRVVDIHVQATLAFPLAPPSISI
jgi:hypothetical protein